MASGSSSPQEEMYDFGIISTEEDNDLITFLIELLRHCLSGRKLLFSSFAPGNDNEETGNVMEFMSITLRRSRVILLCVTPNFPTSNFAKFFVEQKFVQEIYTSDDIVDKTLRLSLCKKGSVHDNTRENSHIMTFIRLYKKHDLSFLYTKYLQGYEPGDDIETFLDRIPKVDPPRPLKRFIKDTVLKKLRTPQGHQWFRMPSLEGDVISDGPESPDGSAAGYTSMLNPVLNQKTAQNPKKSSGEEKSRGYQSDGIYYQYSEVPHRACDNEGACVGDLVTDGGDCSGTPVTSAPTMNPAASDTDKPSAVGSDEFEDQNRQNFDHLHQPCNQESAAAYACSGISLSLPSMCGQDSQKGAVPERDTQPGTAPSTSEHNPGPDSGSFSYPLHGDGSNSVRHKMIQRADHGATRDHGVTRDHEVTRDHAVTRDRGVTRDHESSSAHYRGRVNYRTDSQGYVEVPLNMLGSPGSPRPILPSQGDGNRHINTAQHIESHPDSRNHGNHLIRSGVDQSEQVRFARDGEETIPKDVADVHQPEVQTETHGGSSSAPSLPSVDGNGDDSVPQEDDFHGCGQIRPEMVTLELLSATIDSIRIGATEPEGDRAELTSVTSRSLNLPGLPEGTG